MSIVVTFGMSIGVAAGPDESDPERHLRGESDQTDAVISRVRCVHRGGRSLRQLSRKALEEPALFVQSMAARRLPFPQ
jgi:hypothetical protein